MAIINQATIQKKINDAVRSKIKIILTPEEFGKVQFVENGTKLEWKTTEEIKKKIMDGLKTDT